MIQQDFLNISRKTYQEISRIMLTKLCQQYDLPEIDVVFDKTLLSLENDDKYDDFYGQLDIKNNRIIVNEDKNPISYDTTVFHEFRHYWQAMSKKYYQLYCWWLSKENRPFYIFAYDTPICNIEEDARVFAESKGTKNREDLLDDYDIDTLICLKYDLNQYQLTLQYLEYNVEK